jgi:hypothetical protein
VLWSPADQSNLALNEVPMPLKLQCPICKTPALVPDEDRGKVLHCGKCRKPYRVPPPPAPAPTEAVLEARPNGKRAVQARHPLERVGDE